VNGRILVAGIGNVFLSDDAFGVEVAHRLAGHPLPEGARVEDYGIRGIHLAFELLEGYDALVLIDAVPMGEPPGTLAVIEPELGAGDADDADDAPAAPAVDAHTMSPDVVLATLANLGGSVGRVVIVGCQPADLREGMGLSAAVADAVDDAVDLCLEVLAGLADLAEVAGLAGLARPPQRDPHVQPAQGGTPS
jgi:hydrogenase maturation protease